MLVWLSLEMIVLIKQGDLVQRTKQIVEVPVGVISY